MKQLIRDLMDSVKIIEIFGHTRSTTQLNLYNLSTQLKLIVFVNRCFAVREDLALGIWVGSCHWKRPANSAMLRQTFMEILIRIIIC